MAGRIAANLQHGNGFVYIADQDGPSTGEAFQMDLKTGAVIQPNAQLLAGGDVFTFKVLGGTRPAPG